MAEQIINELLVDQEHIDWLIALAIPCAVQDYLDACRDALNKEQDL